MEESFQAPWEAAVASDPVAMPREVADQPRREPALGLCTRHSPHPTHEFRPLTS